MTPLQNNNTMYNKVLKNKCMFVGNIGILLQANFKKNESLPAEWLYIQIDFNLCATPFLLNSILLIRL